MVARYPSSTALAAFAPRATLRRSWSLLTGFRFEQSDPARFYGAIARDTAELLDSVAGDLLGRTVVDVGGGPGYFEAEFAARGAQYLPIEPDPREMHAAGIATAAAVRGSGMALPLRDNSVDVCLSSNVAEHVADPWLMADEMLRVTKPGGLMVLSYTVWLGPFGGHEMGQTHYFGGERAARWYTRRHGHPPKNRYGTSLFAVSCRAGLDWARAVPPDRGEWIAAFPRYHPSWAWWIIKVPVLREFLTSNLVVVIRAA